MRTMTNETRALPRRSAVPLSVDLVVVGAAVVCATVLWATVALWGGVDLEVRSGGTVREIGGAAVAGVTALVAVLGMGLLRLLERRTARAPRTWTVVALAVLAVSLLGPLGATSAAATGTLLALHAVVATVLLVAAHRSRAVWARD